MPRKNYLLILAILTIIGACKNPQTENQDAPSTFAESQVLQLSKEKDLKFVFYSTTGDEVGPYAAALFNHLAKKRNIKYLASSRSLNPEKTLHSKLFSQLESERFTITDKNPIAFSDFDMLYAKNIISFDPLPEKYAGAKHVLDWSDAKEGTVGEEVDYDELRNKLTPKINAIFSAYGK